MTTPTHIIGPGGAGLDERLQLAEHIIGALDKGIAVLAPDATIRWANDAFCQWCNHNPIGQPFLAALNLPPDSTNILDAVAAAHGGSATCIRVPLNQVLLDITLSLARDGGGPGNLVAFCDDVTATVKRQQKLNALYDAGQEMESLNPEALTDMNFETRVELLKQNIHTHISSLLHYDVIEIRLYDPETNRLLPLMAEGMLPEAAARVLYALPEGNGITGYVAATKKAYLCHDASVDPHFLQGSAGAKSSMTVPILFQDELIGTFNVESPRIYAFGDEDLQFTELFARGLGRSLHTLELLKQQELRTAGGLIKRLNHDATLPLDSLLAAASSLLTHSDTTAKDAKRVLDEANKLKAVINKWRDRVLPLKASEYSSALAGHRVLVLEPDERIRRTAHTLLEGKGCIVEAATTADDAIAMAQAGNYDTIMMAVKLTGGGGTEAFFSLLKAAPNAHFILLRGCQHDPAHTEYNIRSAGHNPTVLFKPFQEEYLYPTVAKMPLPRSNF